MVTVEDDAINVNVGSVNHPMAPEHFIEWVYVQTERGGQRKALKPGDDPTSPSPWEMTRQWLFTHTATSTACG